MLGKTSAALVLCTIYCLSLSSDARADTNTVSIPPIANAWVSNDSDNNESETSVIKRNNPYGSGSNGAGGNIYYLRFELEELSRLIEVTDATLDFYVVALQDGSTSFNVVALNDGYTNAVRFAETNWTAVLSRTDAPGITPTAGGVPNSETSPLLGQTLADGTVGTTVNVSLDAVAMNSRVLNDTNGELTLIVYGTPGANGLASVATISNSSGHPVPTLTIHGNFKPPLGTVISLK